MWVGVTHGAVLLYFCLPAKLEISNNTLKFCVPFLLYHFSNTLNLLYKTTTLTVIVILGCYAV